ncbi:hypothetical protein [Streptomyces sp. NRRL F-2664]|uniref:hypothetical protein n=1 Tax=Streptomyces sp. NRRL F-2664 TaxID=1463842 RepID=UPI0004CA6DB1|nr:hypothetical protein [Streptomyces sp. NRRL F-2664]
MKSVIRAVSVLVLALGSAVFGNGAAVAAPASSDDLPVIIQCNNPTNLSLVDASGGDSLVSQLIELITDNGGTGTNDGNNASAVDTGAGGIAVGGDASQSANNNRCGLSSDVDASTRIDNSQRVDNSRNLTLDSGPSLL